MEPPGPLSCPATRCRRARLTLAGLLRLGAAVAGRAGAAEAPGQVLAAPAGARRGGLGALIHVCGGGGDTGVTEGDAG